MSIKELISFVETNFPDKANDINFSLELVKDSLYEIVKEGNKKITKLSSEYKYDQAEAYLKKLKEIKKYQDKVEESINLFEGYTKREDKPDYSKFKVDDKKPHSLNEDFTNEKPYAFVLGEEGKTVSTWKKMLLETSKILIAKDKNIFLSFISDKEMQGKKRKYIVLNKEEIRRARKLNIGDKSIYIETNFSANDITKLIIKMLGKYSISIDKYEIYLKADYSELHK